MEPELSWYVSQNYLPGNWDHFGQLWKELADYAWLKSLPKAQRTQGIESLNYIEFLKPINPPASTFGTSCVLPYRKLTCKANPQSKVGTFKKQS